MTPSIVIGLLFFNYLKIAGFGMSRDLQDENYYISNVKKIPIKWTAPEVCCEIHKFSFSHKFIIYFFAGTKFHEIFNFK